jgi:hypothetical protein
MIKHYLQQKEKTGKQDQLVSAHARVHVQVAGRYVSMNRDYLPISSGKQWHREKHQGNNNAGSSNRSLIIKCNKLNAVEAEVLS